MDRHDTGRRVGRPYERSAQAIERRAAGGGSLVEIEYEIVRDAPVDEDCRAALWLYAWNQTEGGSGRRTRPARALERYGG